MVAFEKTILKEGKYRQWNETLKKYEFVPVTRERLQNLVQTFTKMKSSGMKIPGPWKHDFGITALSIGDNGLLADSTQNAGFWDDLTTKIDSDGKMALVGKIDAPGDPNDPNTPAGKIGTIVKDTSIYTRRNVPLTDQNDTLDEAIMHIALVTHPIENGQSNFQLKEEESNLVMSNMVDDEDLAKEQSEDDDESNPTNLTQLVEDLKNICKLYLPPSTTIDNIVENLSIAVGQYKLLNSSEDGSGVKTDSFQVEPLLMSHLDATQIDALIQGRVTNPKTGKAYAKEDFATAQPSQPDTQTQLVMAAMQNSMQADRRRSYRSRIDSLVGSGRTTKAFADSNLYPQADGYNIEFKDGAVDTPMIESLIMSLESIPAPERAAHTLVMGSNVADEDNISDTELQETAKYMASLI